jgi:glyoxylase-like metal-dependent hydrolase (beta-lactamase superfamily II)
MRGAIEKQISPNIWQIGTFEFTQYLIGNPPVLLMEGGISPQSLLILSQLETRGADPETLHYLCILHSHFDHLGTFYLIKEKIPDAKIVSGEKNIEILSRPRILERMLVSSKDVTVFAKEIDFLPAIYEVPEFSPFTIDVPLKDGNILKIDSLALKFVALPGHSPDAMGVYLSEDGVFFCSDMAGLYFPDGTIRPNYYFSLKDYETSLERIYRFDIETLCFGHNGTLTGYKEVKHFLEQSIDFTNKLKKQIKDWFEAGKDLEKLAQQFAHGARKGFLAFFPYEHNLMLSRLIIRRTLEYYGLSG